MHCYLWIILVQQIFINLCVLALTRDIKYIEHRAPQIIKFHFFLNPSNWICLISEIMLAFTREGGMEGRREGEREWIKALLHMVTSRLFLIYFFQSLFISFCIQFHCWNIKGNLHTTRIDFSSWPTSFVLYHSEEVLKDFHVHLTDASFYHQDLMLSCF